MKNLIKISLSLLLCVGVVLNINGQTNKNVIVENNVFKVSYNETLEQPNWVEYKVRSITKKADREGMDFYTVKGVYTSNSADYKHNVYDKGHMAPAAAFTDSYKNLKTTFSYLNCSLQFDKLNRGAWRELEAAERVWARKFGTLLVRIDLEFKKGHKVLPTGGHVPSGYYKHIIFPIEKKIKGGVRVRTTASAVCYYFPNSIPTKNWKEYQIECKLHETKHMDIYR